MILFKDIFDGSVQRYSRFAQYITVIVLLFGIPIIGLTLHFLDVPVPNVPVAPSETVALTIKLALFLSLLAIVLVILSGTFQMHLNLTADEMRIEARVPGGVETKSVYSPARFILSKKKDYTILEVEDSYGTLEIARSDTRGSHAVEALAKRLSKHTHWPLT